MAYRDPLIKKRHFVYFFIFLIVASLWNLGLPELSNQESFTAIIAKGIMNNPLATILTYQDNEIITTHPFYIRFLASLGYFYPKSLNYEWIIRLPSVIAGICLIILSYFYCYKYVSREASLAVSALIASSFIFWRMISYSNQEIILTFFLTLAWLTFHYLAQTRKYRKWGLWLICALSLFFGFQCAGWRVFILFYVPLFFQRRYYRTWQYLILPQHIVSLIVVLLAIIFLPGWNQNTDVLSTFITNPGKLNWFNHWLTFPIKSLLYLLPAGICFWIGYCSWYRSLDQQPPMFNSFFRRTVLIVLFLLWFFPGSSPRQIILILPLLAILSSESVAILIRRGESFFAFIWDYCSKLSFGLTALATIFMWMIYIKVIIFKDLNLVADGLFSACSLSVFLIISFILCFKKNRYPFFLRFFTIFVVIRISWQMALVPISTWINNSHRYHGLEILSGKSYAKEKENISFILPEKCIIFREVDKLPEIPGESYYLNRPIIATTNLENTLLEYEKKGLKTFYVLTGGKKPELSEKSVKRYEWKAISAICYIERKNIISFEMKSQDNPSDPSLTIPYYLGTIKREKATQGFEGEIKARMYCGTLNENLLEN